MRIVSLIPSASEIVVALGLQESLVGRSHECDFPKGIAHLPICTQPKFDPEGSSAEIDERVRSIVKDALSVYQIPEGVLEELKPDVIVTQSQCWRYYPPSHAPHVQAPLLMGRRMSRTRRIK